MAYSGELALQTAAEFKPEAVVCDVGLPKMDGHEVARALRRDPHQAGTVLVAVTGWGTEEDKRRTRDAFLQQFRNITITGDVSLGEHVLGMVSVMA